MKNPFAKLTTSEKIKVAVAAAVIAILLFMPIWFLLRGGWSGAGARWISEIVSRAVSSTRSQGSSASSAFVTLDEPYEQSASFQASEVRNLDLEWRSGSLSVVPGTGDRLVVHVEVPAGSYELDPLEASFTMRGDTLVVDDGLPSDTRGKDYPPMRLTVELPAGKDWSLEDVAIASVSSDAELIGVACDSVTLDSVDAQYKIEGIDAQTVTCSGVDESVELSGRVAERLEFNTVDGTQTLALVDGLPKELAVSSIDAVTNLSLAKGSGFTLDVTEATIDVQSELGEGLERTGEGMYIYGDGSSHVTIDGLDASIHLTWM